MFEELVRINERPEPFQIYTASDLWTDPYTSKQMLAYHLNGDVDVSSRKARFIKDSVAWIVSEFGVDENFRIADFGCGPGLYTTALAQQGAQVTGIDFSETSLDYATKVAARDKLKINYAHQNYLEFETEERFDLLLMIMCDFCVLSPAQRKQLLGNFHRILEPGGSVLLDVNSLAAFDQKVELATYEENQLNGFWSADRYYGFVNTFKYEEEKVVLDKYTIIESDRTRTFYNWFQHFSPETLEREFAEAGFSVKGFYSDVAGTPFEPTSAEFAVIAERP